MKAIKFLISALGAFLCKVLQKLFNSDYYHHTGKKKERKENSPYLPQSVIPQCCASLTSHKTITKAKLDFIKFMHICL